MRTDLLALTTVAYLLKATGVLLITIGAATLLRRAPAGTKHTLWLGALVLILALPLLARALPEWRVLPLRPDLLAGSAALWQAPAPPLAGSGASGLGARTAEPSRVSGETRAADGHAAPSGDATFAGSALALPRADPVVALVGLWALGMLLVLARLAGSALALRRILREADSLGSSDWTTPLWEAADRLDLANAPRLLRSERVTMPFACGLLRPTIVLPASADEWSPSRRRAVLFHELAHIRRRDLVGHTLGRVACAIYWMHPLVWTAARRLRAESERACDDLVLFSGTPASEYADHLLQILVGVRGNDAPTVALPMGRRREFEGRMLAILDPALRRHRPTLAHAGVMGGLAVAALLLLMVAPASWGRAGEVEPAPPPIEPLAALDQPAAGEHGDIAVTVTPSVAVSLLEAHPVGPVPSATQGDPGDPGPQPWPEPQKNIPLLIRLLATDESAQVRRTAAWGLAEPDRPDAAAALVRALAADADAGVREMAAWALRGATTPEAVGALIAAFGDASPDVRARAAWALGHSHAADGATIDALAAALNDESGEVLEAAAWALGTLHPAKAPAPLYGAALSHEQADVRLAAAWALGQIADPAARPNLLGAFQRETDERALEGMTWALLALGAVDATTVETLLASGSPGVRAQAVRIAAGANDPWPWPWPWPDVRIRP